MGAKLCKDCKSFIDEPYPRCTTHVDMIRGEPLLCAVARGSEMHCGQSGKGFQSKDGSTNPMETMTLRRDFLYGGYSHGR